MRSPWDYDVVVVGAGVTSAGLAWAMAKYSNVRSILVVEKYLDIAKLNSSPHMNAQSVHCGGAETNIWGQHRRDVRRASRYLLNLLHERESIPGLSQEINHMVVGVGREEVGVIEARALDIRDEYPEFQLLSPRQIKEVEPNVMLGRDPREPICALSNPHGRAANYQFLAKTLFHDAQVINPDLELRLGVEVVEVRKNLGGYVVETTKGTFTTRVLVFGAGAYSLYFAQKLGIGLDYGILTVKGDFWDAGEVVFGKVYGVQEAARPFARVHVDRSILTGRSRFGPTTLPELVMEVGNYQSFFDYMKLPTLRTVRGAVAVADILAHNGMLPYVAKNLSYRVPGLGKRLFLQEAQRLIPSLGYGDLTLLPRAGGVRPQLVDLTTKKLIMGDVLLEGDNLLAFTTPSPGATNSIGNGKRGSEKIVSLLGENFHFDAEAFERELGKPLPYERGA